VTAVVADTPALVWYLRGDPNLSATALAAIEDALTVGNPVHFATVSLVEVTYLVEKGRLPQSVHAMVTAVLSDPRSGIRPVPFDLAMAEALARVPRAIVPDMPDRMITATAIHLGLPLITRDARIRRANVPTIW